MSGFILFAQPYLLLKSSLPARQRICVDSEVPRYFRNPAPLFDHEPNGLDFKLLIELPSVFFGPIEHLLPKGNIIPKTTIQNNSLFVFKVERITYFVGVISTLFVLFV